MINHIKRRINYMYISKNHEIVRLYDDERSETYLTVISTIRASIVNSDESHAIE